MNFKYYGLEGKYDEAAESNELREAIEDFARSVGFKDNDSEVIEVKFQPVEYLNRLYSNPVFDWVTVTIKDKSMITTFNRNIKENN